MDFSSFVLLFISLVQFTWAKFIDVPVYLDESQDDKEYYYVQYVLIPMAIVAIAVLSIPTTFIMGTLYFTLKFLLPAVDNGDDTRK